MARVSRRVSVAAPRQEVWRLLSDPYHLPRWWPRCERVEGVREPRAGDRARWTMVLKTDRRNIVRADYRQLSSSEPTRMVWEQELEGTPFERILTRAVVEIELAEEGSSTMVVLSADQRLRGLSRLGSPMVRRGTARMLDEALSGVERAFEGGEE
jgi:uncharacterized protein YndB with AHSA1/START domain